MALLPDEPRKRNAVFAILAAVVVVGLVYQFVYTPTNEELAVEREQLENLEAANRSAQLTYARGGGNIEEQLALYERHVRQLEQLIPASEEVSALLNNITAEARAANVEIANISPEGQQPGTYYSRDSYAMAAIGEYHAVGRFLTAIASLPRIITPRDVDLEEFTNAQIYADRMEDPVQVTFRIETFVLPEPGQGPPPAEVGGQGGGA